MAGTESKSKAVQQPLSAELAGSVTEPRRRGRRSKRDAKINHGRVEVSRAVIIEHAIKLSREESLDEISIVRLAKE